MLITKDNFKYQNEFAYDGEDKYPRYILRGKKISKELAEKIIVTETKADFLEFNHDIKNYNRYSIKKPLSIRETKDEEEREKCINAIYDESAIDNLDQSNEGNFDSTHFEQYFEDNTPLSTFVDANGFVGATGITYKYPMSFEYLVDHLEYSNRYPFLEYVIIYTDYDEYLSSNELLEFACVYPPLLTNVNQIFEAFTYALYVHDGGVEVVNKDEAVKLYRKYQKEYSNDLIFERNDYDKYVKNTFKSDDIPLLLENWEMKPKLKKEIKVVYKNHSLIKNIDNWIKNEKHTITDEQYLKLKNMFRELDNICSGKKTKLPISNDLYEQVKVYLDVIFKYHDNMNKVKDLEKYLKTELNKEDYDIIYSIVYTHKYNRKSIEDEYKKEKKKKFSNYPHSFSKRLFELETKMFDELEHIRKGEETILKYNKSIINKLKKYIDAVVDANSDIVSNEVLYKVWDMERELKSRMDENMYKIMTDAILYTKSSSYDLDKEYDIYTNCRELSILFMNEVKEAVKNKDFELESIDEKLYIKKFNKLRDEYKKIVNKCLYFV